MLPIQEIALAGLIKNNGDIARDAAQNARDVAETLRRIEQQNKWPSSSAQTPEWVKIIEAHHKEILIQKDKEIVKWLCKAAEYNDADAQLTLGFRYMSGEGVPKNYVETYKWLLLSVIQRGGPSESTINLEFFQGCEQEMTPEQVTEARRLVSEFKPK